MTINTGFEQGPDTRNLNYGYDEVVYLGLAATNSLNGLITEHNRLDNEVLIREEGAEGPNDPKYRDLETGYVDARKAHIARLIDRVSVVQRAMLTSHDPWEQDLIRDALEACGVDGSFVETVKQGVQRI